MAAATAIAIGGALLGGLGGAQGTPSSSSSSSSSGINLSPATQAEQNATSGINSDYSSLRSMADQGPGSKDVGAAYGQTNALASMLSDYSKTGGAASQQDILQAQDSAKLQFAPQQVALNQSFTEEKQRAAQLAAQLGRPVNDPYIQAQLGKERMNNQQMIAANQGAYVNQQSQQNSLNRLGYTQQLTDVKNSLASQAMSNRQALLSIGQGIQTNERNFRLSTGTRWGNQQQSVSSGGGLGGAISGAIGGAGIGMGIGKFFGGGTTPATPQEGFTSSGGSAPAGMAGPGYNMASYAEPQAMPQMARASRINPIGGGPNMALMGNGPTNYNPRQMYNYNQSGTDSNVQGLAGWAASPNAGYDLDHPLGRIGQ